MLTKVFSLPEVYKSDADARITRLFLGLPEYKLANTIFSFVGVEHEINTRTFLYHRSDFLFNKENLLQSRHLAYIYTCGYLCHVL